MELNNQWNWRQMISPHWLTPAQNVYYYIHEWKKYQTVIDVGAGVGRHSLLFARNGYLVTAFDSSKVGLQIIEERAKEESLPIKIVHGDMKDMPFEQGAFDAVLAFHSIYHAYQDEMPAIINELFRIVKTNGEVLVTMLSKDDESFTANYDRKISDNVVLKRDGKNGPLVPHFYIDYNEINCLFHQFNIMECQKITEFIQGHVLAHYYIRLRRE